MATNDMNERLCAQLVGLEAGGHRELSAVRPGAPSSGSRRAARHAASFSLMQGRHTEFSPRAPPFFGPNSVSGRLSRHTEHIFTTGSCPVLTRLQAGGAPSSHLGPGQLTLLEGWRCPKPLDRRALKRTPRCLIGFCERRLVYLDFGHPCPPSSGADASCDGKSQVTLIARDEVTSARSPPRRRRLRRLPPAPSSRRSSRPARRPTGCPARWSGRGRRPAPGRGMPFPRTGMSTP